MRAARLRARHDSRKLAALSPRWASPSIMMGGEVRIPYRTPFILLKYLIILGYWGSTGIYPIRRPIPAPPLAAMHPQAGLGTRHEFLIRDENRERYATRHARSPKEGASMRPTGQGGVPPNHRQGSAPDQAYIRRRRVPDGAP